MQENYSDDSEVMQELMNKLNAMSEENKSLRVELKAEKERTQRLSSENSMLRSELLNLQERNEMLSRSDLLLKDAEKKLREANQRNAEAEAMMAKARNEGEAAKREKDEAAKERTKAREAQERTEQRAQELAKKMVQERLNSLEKNFESKTAAWSGSAIGALLYGIVFTVMLGWRSDALRGDLSHVFSQIGSLICGIWNFGFTAAEWTSDVAYYIPQDLIATVVHGAVYLIVLLLAWVILYGTSLAVPAFLVAKYRKLGVADKYSLGWLMFSVAVVVVFANQLSEYVGVNLFLLLFLVNMAYALIRVVDRNQLHRWTS